MQVNVFLNNFPEKFCFIFHFHRMVERIFLRLSPRSHWLGSVMENFSLESRTFQKLRSKGKHWTWSKNCFAALTTILCQQPCVYYDINIAFTHAIFEAEAISVSYFIDEQHKKQNHKMHTAGMYYWPDLTHQAFSGNA